jgi:hypothetical protein
MFVVLVPCLKGTAPWLVQYEYIPAVSSFTPETQQRWKQTDPRPQRHRKSEETTATYRCHVETNAECSIPAFILKHTFYISEKVAPRPRNTQHSMGWPYSDRVKK